MALFFQRLRFPPDLSRVCDYTATDAQMRGITHDHARREQVEFDAAGRMAGIGAAVEFEDNGNGRAGAAELVGYFGNQTTFAFVAEGYAHVGDQLAGEREQGHG